MEIFSSNNRFNRQLLNLLRYMLKYNVFKFDFEGEGFQLKSGKMSPIYIDLRECFSNAVLMKLAAESLQQMIQRSNLKFDAIVGVPYAALPYSSLISAKLEYPLIIIRKEAKTYGTKKLIEGKYKNGDTVIIIEDVVTTGGSIKTVVETLRADGLIVNDVFCLLDRDQGGIQQLKQEGITLHSLLDMKTVLSFVKSMGIVDDNQMKQIISALELGYTTIPTYDIGKEVEDIYSLPHVDTKRESLKSRAERAKSSLKKHIFKLMEDKQSNLCLAVDYTTADEVLKIADLAGPYVISIKIHSDAIVDFTADCALRLVELAEKHRFLIFEDRKFGDIGNTNMMQLKGSHAIAKWADLVTVHAVQGSDSISTVFRSVVEDESFRLKGILLIAELSSKGSLTSLPSYTKQVVAIGERNEDIVCGFICQSRVSNTSDMLHWTPGVHLNAKSDISGQQWRDIHQAIDVQQNDIVIVGRGITASEKPIEELKKYKSAAWNHFTE